MSKDNTENNKKQTLVSNLPYPRRKTPTKKGINKTDEKWDYIFLISFFVILLIYMRILLFIDGSVQ